MNKFLSFLGEDARWSPFHCTRQSRSLVSPNSLYDLILSFGQRNGWLKSSSWIKQWRLRSNNMCCVLIWRCLPHTTTFICCFASVRRTCNKQWDSEHCSLPTRQRLEEVRIFSRYVFSSENIFIFFVGSFVFCLHRVRHARSRNEIPFPFCWVHVHVSDFSVSCRRICCTEHELDSH